MDFVNKIGEKAKKLTDDAKKNKKAVGGGGSQATSTSGGRVGTASNKSSTTQANNNVGFKNPFANLGGANKPGGRNYRGGGQSLGGSNPGKVLRLELPMAGPLGVQVENSKNQNKSAIVSRVLPGTQAQQAGLQRGDIICRAGTGGIDEIGYAEFLRMAASDVRPLIFDVRRINSVPGGSGGGAAAASSKTADAFAKRQAVIAAAEARDKAHKKRTKPVRKGGNDLSAAERRRIVEQREALAKKNAEEGIGTNSLSDEARMAIEAAKVGEAKHAAELGYNPYETNKVSAGQARTATIAVSHGALDSGQPGGGGEASAVGPGTTAPPSDPTSTTGVESSVLIDPLFDEALKVVTMHASDSQATIQSLTIMKKLIANATTKGQSGPDETSAKFRRVRLSNPKIRAAVADVHGALDLMMSVGFVLSENEDDGETYLVFPPGDTGPPWLPSALARMESHTKRGV